MYVLSIENIERILPSLGLQSGDASVSTKAQGSVIGVVKGAQSTCKEHTEDAVAVVGALLLIEES